jgi:hypothetical protein
MVPRWCRSHESFTASRRHALRRQLLRELAACHQRGWTAYIHRPHGPCSQDSDAHTCTAVSVGNVKVDIAAVMSQLKQRKESVGASAAQQTGAGAAAACKHCEQKPCRGVCPNCLECKHTLAQCAKPAKGAARPAKGAPARNSGAHSIGLRDGAIGDVKRGCRSNPPKNPSKAFTTCLAQMITAFEADSSPAPAPSTDRQCQHDVDMGLQSFP